MARYRTTARAVLLGAVLAFVAAAVLACAALEPWDSFGPGRDAGVTARDASADACADGADCVCAQMMIESQCESCCNAHHDEASVGLYMGQYYGCVCEQSVCLAQCTVSDCADGSSVPGDPCYACETDASAPGGPCSPQNICLQNADCVAIANCYNNCPY